jgi:hypothetical protein
MKTYNDGYKEGYAEGLVLFRFGMLSYFYLVLDSVNNRTDIHDVTKKNIEGMLATMILAVNKLYAELKDM